MKLLSLAIERHFRELDKEVKNSSIALIVLYFTATWIDIDYSSEKHEQLCLGFLGDSIWWWHKDSSHSERLGTAGLWLSEEGGWELQQPSLHCRDYPTSHPENQRVSGTFSNVYCMYICQCSCHLVCIFSVYVCVSRQYFVGLALSCFLLGCMNLCFELLSVKKTSELLCFFKINSFMKPLYPVKYVRNKPRLGSKRQWAQTPQIWLGRLFMSIRRQQKYRYRRL